MLTLANDQMRLTVEPDYGARVTSLTDLATGREWLVQGKFASDVGGHAVYGSDTARGWDECFPTVGACSHPAWGDIRDHGAMWGRPWQVIWAGPDRVETRFMDTNFTFSRSLTLKDNAVTADYAVTNLGDADFAYLWSQHCLLTTTPDDRIALSGQSRMLAGGEAYVWPDHPSRNLTAVGPIAEGFALKSYALTPGHASAAIINPKSGIRFDWADIPAFGLWLSYGGWPAGGGVHQVALEPTTAAADELAGAEALGQARVLAPLDTHHWQVTITLIGPETRT